MTTGDFLSELFYRRDGALEALPNPPPASLWPREVVTSSILFAFKGYRHR